MKEIKKIFARNLRKEQTESEKKLWELIRNRKFFGLKFRRQHVVEGFVVDFYCNEIRLGIEVDGGIHLKRKDYDRLRLEIIESKDIVIIRITNKELRNNKNDVFEILLKAFARHKIPLPLGEGCKG